MKIVTFGEIMARLSPPGFLRLRQAVPGPLDVSLAGAEANVAVSLALLGAEAEFVTALPRHAIADACLDTLRGLGVATDHVVRTDAGRLGLYFLETGANQRASQVIYDREGTAIALAPSASYDWDAVFRDALWFHVTGITPALSEAAAEVVLSAAQQARDLGLTVSCDLNFRKKLWRWDPQASPRELAERTMRKLLPHVSVLIANEEDCADVLQIRAGDTDVHAGRLAIDRYPDVARQVVGQFASIGHVAITLRESISASHNNWGAMLYCAADQQAHFAPTVDGDYQPYEIKNIVDRVGGGDAFAAGLIYAINSPAFSHPSSAIRFATAASCLAHSVVGDLNFVSRAEVEALMEGSASGRVVR